MALCELQVDGLLRERELLLPFPIGNPLGRSPVITPGFLVKGSFGAALPAPPGRSFKLAALGALLWSDTEGERRELWPSMAWGDLLPLIYSCTHSVSSQPEI